MCSRLCRSTSARSTSTTSGDALDSDARFARRVALGGGTVDVGRQEAVVAHGAVRPSALLDLEECGQRDHFARTRPHLELADVLSTGAKLCVHLYANRIGAPELVADENAFPW